MGERASERETETEGASRGASETGTNGGGVMRRSRGMIEPGTYPAGTLPVEMNRHWEIEIEWLSERESANGTRERERMATLKTCSHTQVLPERCGHHSPRGSGGYPEWHWAQHTHRHTETPEQQHTGRTRKVGRSQGARWREGSL